MASSGITDESKSRTIAHMNKDHTTDMMHMLQHFGLSSATVSTGAPVLVDITLDALHFQDGQVIRIDPPMASWDDRRQRLIDMTIAARAALCITAAADADPASLPAHSSNGNGSTASSTSTTNGGGRSHGKHPAPRASSGSGPPPRAGGDEEVVVRDFHGPRGLDWLVFGSVLFYFCMYAAVVAGLAEPGSAIATAVERAHFPLGLWGFQALVRAIIVPVIIIHVSELVYLDHTRLSRHSVARGSRAWFLWLASNFFEGVRTFQRFDRILARLRREREKVAGKKGA